MAVEDQPEEGVPTPTLDALVTELEALAQEAAQRLRESPRAQEIASKFDALVADLQASIAEYRASQEEAPPA
jgi:hypothetical protein